MANLLNPEYKNAKICDSYINWNVNELTGKQSGGIVLEVEFEDGARRQKLLMLTENAAIYTTRTLKSLGFKGSSFMDFTTPQLVGTEVVCTITDAVDKNGVIRTTDDGKVVREIAFINLPRKGYKKATEEEAKALCHHFDAYLTPDNAKKSVLDNSKPNVDEDLPF